MSRVFHGILSALQLFYFCVNMQNNVSKTNSLKTQCIIVSLVGQIVLSMLVSGCYLVDAFEFCHLPDIDNTTVHYIRKLKIAAHHGQYSCFIMARRKCSIYGGWS